eukprot:4947837-Prymnesium_polylepis.1
MVTHCPHTRSGSVVGAWNARTRNGSSLSLHTVYLFSVRLIVKTQSPVCCCVVVPLSSVDWQINIAGTATNLGRVIGRGVRVTDAHPPLLACCGQQLLRVGGAVQLAPDRVLIRRVTRHAKHWAFAAAPPQNRVVACGGCFGLDGLQLESARSSLFTTSCAAVHASATAVPLVVSTGTLPPIVLMSGIVGAPSGTGVAPLGSSMLAENACAAALLRASSVPAAVDMSGHAVFDDEYGSIIMRCAPNSSVASALRLAACS